MGLSSSFHRHAAIMLARRAASTLSRAAFQASARRSIATSAISRKDYVQDLYLRELKGYKPKEVAANSHVGQVKEFHSPTAPTAPSVPSSADLAKELDAYEREDVPTSSAASAGANESEGPEDGAQGQTADEYLAFVEKEARHRPEAHH
ncbi:MAG: hypothetical protein CYPHOPRED_002503 [Cyphobasidiales sp. Tagirdzhanova-0007]|nr:MAG: hypothetical protein CYPHOPRED_002503 [Cyphobasidiales sp. Tagirdzhanova-0007]